MTNVETDNAMIVHMLCAVFRFGGGVWVVGEDKVPLTAVPVRVF